MKKILILLLCTTALAARAQHNKPAAVSSAGAITITPGNMHEWSVGEPVMISAIPAGKTAAEQLPATAKAEGLFLVYPVPSSAFVNVRPHINAGSKMEMSLFDASGKQVLRKEVQLIRGNELQMLDVRRLSPGSYILRLSSGISGETVSGTYTIIKN